VANYNKHGGAQGKSKMGKNPSLVITLPSEKYTNMYNRHKLYTL
jgi:hypothetical protein